MRAHCTHRFSRQIFLYPLAEVIAAADGFDKVVADAVRGGTLKPHEGGGGVTLVTRDGVANSIVMWCCCKFNFGVVLLQIQLWCGVVANSIVMRCCCKFNCDVVLQSAADVRLRCCCVARATNLSDAAETPRRRTFLV